MKDFLIENYISKLTFEDILNYAVKEGITLTNEEIKIVDNYLKKNWRTLLYGNPKGILDELKFKLAKDSYQKIETLYERLKNKVT